MKEFDVTIIGAGLAGLYLAKNLASENASVLLVDRKTDLTKGIHTTGIFVRKTFEDFDFPPGALGRPISDVTLYSPSLRKLELRSTLEEFRVGKMGFLYQSLLDECRSLGVLFKPGHRYAGSVPAGSKKEPSSIVSIESKGLSEQFRTRVLVGADGARSCVAIDLRLEANREWIVGYEEVVSGVPLQGRPQLHCFLDEKLAPGYLAWISHDGEETHIGVGGYPSRFDPRESLKVFKQRIVPQVIDISGGKRVETRGGRIPVGGVLKRIANRRGLLIGDAAGAVSPLTAGGLDPCLRLSGYASRVILDSLAAGDAKILKRYSGAMFRKKFFTRLFMRSVLQQMRSRSLLNAAFACLTTAPGRRLAEKIFFRKSSFPDISFDGANSEAVISRRGV